MSTTRFALLTMMFFAAMAIFAPTGHAQDKYVPGPKSVEAWKNLYVESQTIVRQVIDRTDNVCGVDLTTPISTAVANMVYAGQLDRAVMRPRGQDAGLYISGPYCSEKK